MKRNPQIQKNNKLELSDNEVFNNNFENENKNIFSGISKNTTNIIFFLVIYIFFTMIINYKYLFTNFERIIVNDLKDLIYWGKFTFTNIFIVYCALLLIGLDIKKEIEKDNKSIAFLIAILLGITYMFGQKLYM
jgi:hypothetical protein